MAKLSVGIGSSSRSEYIYILDITSTSGAGKTGIAYNTSGLSGHFVRSAGSATSISFVAQTATGAWVSGGFTEVSSTLMPGIYRVDIPDAIFSTGSDKAIVMIRGVSNTVPVTLEYQLVGSDPSLVLSNSSIANTTWSYTSRTITGGIADTVTDVTNGVIVTTNNDKTGYDLSSTQTFDLTGNISGSVGSVTADVNVSTASMSGIAGTVWNTDVSAFTSPSAGYDLTQAASAGGGISAYDVWDFTVIGFGSTNSAAVTLAQTLFNTGNIETYVQTQTPQDIWSYAGIEGRTITGGIADTVTTLTNRSGFAITSNTDKTGYSLSQSFPANFSSLSIAGGKVSIVQSDINSIIASIPEVNYSGIAATTWNFLASAIGNTLSIGYQLTSNLDTTVSSRSTLTSKQVISAIQASVRTVSQVNKDKISKL